MNNMKNIIQLKEMIIEKKLELKNLTEAQLNDLIEYELSSIDEEGFDDSFLNECFAEMNKFHDYSIDKNKSQKIERQAFSKYKNKKEAEMASQKRYIPTRKFVRIAIAIAVLISICSIAIYAIFNPFADFVDSIKDLLNYCKKLTAFILIFALLFSFSTSIYATDGNLYTYTYIEGNMEIEIQYSDLSEDQLLRIVSLFINDNEYNDSSSYGLTCTLFGHDITTTATNVTNHYVYESYPYCELNQYNVDICERCDYSKTTLINVDRVGCCS